MPPRSGAPPQITFCLEYPALNRPASNQLVSNRPASLPPPGAADAGQRAQQGAYSEARRAYKPPPPPFPTRAPPRSESPGACRPHPPRKAVRLEPSCFELFSLEPSRSNLRQGGRHRAASAARRLFGGTTSQQAFPGLQRRRERRRAASRPVPAARIRREKPSASNLPASNYSASNHSA